MHDRQTGQRPRAGVVDSDGTQGTALSLEPGDLSADGRYVAFDRSPSNLVPGDTNGTGTCSCTTGHAARRRGSRSRPTAPRAPTAELWSTRRQRRRPLRRLLLVRGATWSRATPTARQSTCSCTTGPPAPDPGVGRHRRRPGQQRTRMTPIDQRRRPLRRVRLRGRQPGPGRHQRCRRRFVSKGVARIRVS